MTNCDLNETTLNNNKLVFNILAYSHIIKHIKELPRDIQVHLESSVNPVYSQPLHILNCGISQPSNIESTGMLRMIAYSEP